MAGDPPETQLDLALLHTAVPACAGSLLCTNTLYRLQLGATECTSAPAACIRLRSAPRIWCPPTRYCPHATGSADVPLHAPTPRVGHARTFLNRKQNLNPIPSCIMHRTVEEAQRATLRHFDGADLFARCTAGGLKEAGVAALKIVVKIQQERELRLTVPVHVEQEVPGKCNRGKQVSYAP